MISEIVRRCRNINQTLIDHGIYHGDAHLKNFMFTREGFDQDNIKIIDFGKSRETLKRWGVPLDNVTEDDELVTLHFVEWYNLYKHQLNAIMTILVYSDIPLKTGLNVLRTFVYKNGDKTYEELDAIIASIPPRMIDDDNDDDEYVFPDAPSST
jgi:serine/threonine protein kinase